MTSLDKNNDEHSSADTLGSSRHEDECDQLGGHLFRAEIELHYALLEANGRNDHEKASLIEIALATVQACQTEDEPPAARRPQGS